MATIFRAVYVGVLNENTPRITPRGASMLRRTTTTADATRSICRSFSPVGTLAAFDHVLPHWSFDDLPSLLDGPRQLLLHPLAGLALIIGGEHLERLWEVGEVQLGHHFQHGTTRNHRNSYQSIVRVREVINVRC